MTTNRASCGFRFPAEVILWAVRWYLQSPHQLSRPQPYGAGDFDCPIWSRNGTVGVCWSLILDEEQHHENIRTNH
jgi:hypothetical protein